MIHSYTTDGRSPDINVCGSERGGTRFQMINPLQGIKGQIAYRVYCSNRIASRRDKGGLDLLRFLLTLLPWVKLDRLSEVFNDWVLSKKCLVHQSILLLQLNRVVRLFFPSFLLTIETSFLYWTLTRWLDIDKSSHVRLSSSSFHYYFETDFPRSVFFNLCTRSSKRSFIRGITVYCTCDVRGSFLFSSRSNSSFFRVESDMTTVSKPFQYQQFCSSNWISKSRYVG